MIRCTDARGAPSGSAGETPEVDEVNRLDYSVRLPVHLLGVLRVLAVCQFEARGYRVSLEGATEPLPSDAA
jgi:hypothetical protein